MSAGTAAGRLRARLALDLPQDTPDDAGGMTRAHVQVALVWGEIVPRGAREDFIAQRSEARITHVIRLRWRDDVVPEARLRLGTRVFMVRAAIDPTERRRTLECRCEEIR